MRAALVLFLFCLSVSAQISYFNQGLLRQPSAQLDRNYLGIYGSNITGWGPSPPAPFVLRAGDTMSGPLTNNDHITVNGIVYADEFHIGTASMIWSYNQVTHRAEFTQDGETTLTLDPIALNGGVSIGSGANGLNTGVSIGMNSIGFDTGVGIGVNADGNTFGAAVGNASLARTYGAALGDTAHGETYAVGVGHQADTTPYSIAIGYHALCDGVASLSIGPWANSAAAFSMAIGTTNGSPASPALVDASATGAVEIGSGTATVPWGLHYRGSLIVDSNAVHTGSGQGLANVHASSVAGTLTNSITGNAATATGAQYATNTPYGGTIAGLNGTNVFIGTNTFQTKTIAQMIAITNGAQSSVLTCDQYGPFLTLSGGMYIQSNKGMGVNGFNDIWFTTTTYQPQIHSAGNVYIVLDANGDSTGTKLSVGSHSFNSTFPTNEWFSVSEEGNATVSGTLTATNGVRQLLTNSSFASFTMTTNRQFYCLNGTNQVLSLLNAANAAGVIFRFSMTNEFGSFILTNATGAQTIRDGFSLAYTNLGVGEVGLISDGAAWWLASKGKTIMPNAQFSTSTNIHFTLITNSITLQRTDYNKGQGIRLDNTGWLTNGVGSRIYIDYPGDYFLMFSAVWSKGVGSPSNGDVWLRSNSVDVANSMTLMTIQSSATNVMTVSYVLPVKAPCYYDLQAASTDGNGQLQAMPAITSPFNRPACPSIIVTVNKISD